MDAFWNVLNRNYKVMTAFDEGTWGEGGEMEIHQLGMGLLTWDMGLWAP